MGEKDPQATRSKGILDASLIRCANLARGKVYLIRSPTVVLGTFSDAGVSRTSPVRCLSDVAISDLG